MATEAHRGQPRGNPTTDEEVNTMEFVLDVNALQALPTEQLDDNDQAGMQYCVRTWPTYTIED